MKTLSVAPLASQLDRAGAYRNRCLRFKELSQPWWVRMAQDQLSNSGEREQRVHIESPEPARSGQLTVDEQVAELAAAA